MARVVVVTTSYPRAEGDPGGHFVETEARLRVARGDGVTVLAPGPGPSGRGACGAAPRVVWLPGGDAFGAPGALARLRERPSRAIAATRFVLAARRVLARDAAGPDAPDEVVAHWLLPSAYPIATACGAATLTVVVHGTDCGVFERLPGPARRRVATALAARRARVRCVSEDLRARLSRAAPELASRCHVEPPALDVSGAPSRDVARRALGVAPGERLAVIAGRLLPSKRPDVAARLARARGATRVVILGDGPLREALTGLDGVELRGALRRPEALRWIAAADLVVSASLNEGAPTVVREARALRVPVLASPAGDLRRWAQVDPGIELVDE